MSEEMKEAFDVLDINTKRNQISTELMIIKELLTNIETMNRIEPVFQVKNYNVVTDQDLTEAEALTFFYEDIFNIEQELVLLFQHLT